MLRERVANAPRAVLENAFDILAHDYREIDSALLDFRFVHQQDGDSISNGVNAMASRTLERILPSAQAQTLVTFRTNEYLQQIRRDHLSSLPPAERALGIRRSIAVARPSSVRPVEAHQLRTGRLC